MAKTSSPMLLVVVLAGMAAGLWLAAHTGEGAAGAGSSPLLASKDTLHAVADHAPPLAQLDQPLEPDASGRERARPSASDKKLIPAPGETCIALSVEAADGSLPRGVRVALFSVHDERPQFPPASVFEADDDGWVRACAKLDGETDLVAFAPGWRPQSRRLHASTGGRIDLETFVLEPGTSVSGRVTAGDVPLERAEIEASASAPAYEADVDGGRLGWRARCYVWCATRAETDADGNFTIGGLEPGEHTLRLFAVRQRNFAIDVAKVAPRRVDVPGDRIEFALPAARLDLTFEASGKPLCCVEVQIGAGERQFTRRTDDLGRIGFMIQPELYYDLTAGRHGFATKHAQLRGLTNGEHRPERIALEPQRELATLIVEDGGTAGNIAAIFELRPRFPDGRDESLMKRTVSRDPATRKFVLENVPSGSWRVTMRSGTPLSVSGVRSNCDQDFVVEIPDSGRIEVSAPTSVRGGLHVSARLAGGGSVKPVVRLLDPKGDLIDDVIVKDRALPGTDPFVVDANRAAGPSVFVYSSWCAGAIDAVVSADGVPSVTVRTNMFVSQITPVDVELHR